MKTLLYTMIAAILILSCDMPGMIEIENMTESRAFYKSYQKTSNNQVDTIDIELLSEPGKNRADIIFGFGQTWTDARISEYLDSVLAIEIITYQDTIVLIEKNEMFSFFKDKRKGLFKQKIKITLE